MPQGAEHAGGTGMAGGGPSRHALHRRGPDGRADPLDLRRTDGDKSAVQGDTIMEQLDPPQAVSPEEDARIAETPRPEIDHTERRRQIELPPDFHTHLYSRQCEGGQKDRGGYRESGNPLKNDGGDPRQGHQTGNGPEEGPACSWPPIPPPRSPLARSSGPGARRAPRCHLRAWLLLAPPRGLPLRHDAGYPSRLLEKEVRRKRQARSRRTAGSGVRRLEGGHRLGMRASQARSRHCGDRVHYQLVELGGNPSRTRRRS